MQIEKYKLTRDWHNAKAGDTVYKSAKHDYGLARDDSNHFNEDYISVTHKADGDYPFFTVPERLLERID